MYIPLEYIQLHVHIIHVYIHCMYGNLISFSLFIEGNWCSSFTDFGLFPNSFENEFLSDTPTSSFPPTPISSNGSDPLSPLSPEDQQEINDIVSSFETPLAQPYNTETSFVSPSSFILPSSTLPTPPPPLGKRSCTDVSSRSSSKRTSSSKASLTSRKERKKEQNKTAALRYRQKKRNELDLLLKQEEELETTNKQLKDQVESLTTEITYLKNLWSEVCKAKAQ